MGVGSRSPHRVRAAYARALAEIPLPVRSFEGVDRGALTMLAEVEIADRRLQFGFLRGVPRLWVVFVELDPPVLGHLTDLASGRPELHITELDHINWARQPGRAMRIKREAVTVWQAAQRECEG